MLSRPLQPLLGLYSPGKCICAHILIKNTPWPGFTVAHWLDEVLWMRMRCRGTSTPNQEYRSVFFKHEDSCLYFRTFNHSYRFSCVHV